MFSKQLNDVNTFMMMNKFYRDLRFIPNCNFYWYILFPNWYYDVVEQTSEIIRRSDFVALSTST